MENIFVGYRESGVLYGCKDYISNIEEKLKADKMVNKFYHNHLKEEMNEKFKKIFWETPNEYSKGNNGYPFMAYLLEESVETYAQYQHEIRMKISSKTKNELPLYNPTYFKEVDRDIYAIFTNYGLNFKKYAFDYIYVIDLDKDVLIIRDNKRQVEKEIAR